MARYHATPHGLLPPGPAKSWRAVQNLTKALAASENQKEILLREAQESQQTQKDALHYSELANIDLRSARHELSASKASLECLQQRYVKQEAEVLHMRSEAEVQAARTQAERDALLAERDDLNERIAGTHAILRVTGIKPADPPPRWPRSCATISLNHRRSALYLHGHPNGAGHELC